MSQPHCDMCGSCYLTKKTPFDFLIVYVMWIKKKCVSILIDTKTHPQIFLYEDGTVINEYYTWFENKPQTAVRC